MTVKSERLIIGTRGSPLALWQAEQVRAKLAFNGYVSEIKIIKTTGDWCFSHGEVALSNKACFSTEIEAALLAGAIDLAVHSMKDMEVDLPEGLIIPFMLPRADVRDAFLSSQCSSFFDLPKGAVIGTVSPRRKAYALFMRPDLQIVPLRGNVSTRLNKMKDGQVDATFLACAGLERLGMNHEVTSVIAVDDMLPSVGQGAIGIEIREEDLARFSFMEEFSCDRTVLCVEAERGVLRALSGSCHTPVGVLAALEGEYITLRAQVLSLDGQQIWSANESAVISDIEKSVEFGEAAGTSLRANIPEEVLSKNV